MPNLIQPGHRQVVPGRSAAIFKHEEGKKNGVIRERQASVAWQRSIALSGLASANRKRCVQQAGWLGKGGGRREEACESMLRVLEKQTIHEPQRRE